MAADPTPAACAKIESACGGGEEIHGQPQGSSAAGVQPRRWLSGPSPQPLQGPSPQPLQGPSPQPLKPPDPECPGRRGLNGEDQALAPAQQALPQVDGAAADEEGGARDGAGEEVGCERMEGMTGTWEGVSGAGEEEQARGERTEGAERERNGQAQAQAYEVGQGQQQRGQDQHLRASGAESAAAGRAAGCSVRAHLKRRAAVGIVYREGEYEGKPPAQEIFPSVGGKKLVAAQRRITGPQTAATVAARGDSAEASGAGDRELLKIWGRFNRHARAGPFRKPVCFKLHGVHAEDYRCGNE